MSLRRLSLVLVLICFLFASAFAAEYSAEPLNQAAPGDVSPEIARILSEQGVQVKSGSRTACEVWLAKQVKVKSLKPAAGLLYPFEQGQLLGVVRFARRGADFRNQDIGSGVYTLRFAMQPIDGAHVGTSPTRDFLLLLDADQDKSAGGIEYADLTKASATAAGSSHPALLSLQRAAGEAPAGSIRHDSDHDWWIVRLNIGVTDGKETKTMPMDLVVVGQAAE